MNVELVNNLNQFNELKFDWNALLKESNTQSIFLTWEWLYYWWLHFNKDKGLLILLFREKSSRRLLGIAPCYLQKQRLFHLINIKKIRFLGTEIGGSDFLDFIISPGKENDILRLLCEYLVSISDKWDTVEISDICKDSKNNVIIRHELSKHFRIVDKGFQICPFIDLPKNIDESSGLISKKMSKNLRWCYKQLQEKFNVVISINKFIDNILEKSINAFFNLHISRFNAKKAKTTFGKEEIKDFQYDIARNFLKNDWLRFYSVHYCDKIIACLYVFQYKKNTFYYQSGFDPDWQKWSLGSVMIDYAIKSAIKEGQSQFHFLRGNESYKRKWTANYIITETYIVANKSMGGIFELMFLKQKNILKKFIRSLGRFNK